MLEIMVIALDARLHNVGTGCMTPTPKFFLSNEVKTSWTQRLILPRPLRWDML